MASVATIESRELMPDEPRKRTIDERLDALAQTMELLAAMHQDLEKQTAARFAEVAARFTAVTHNFEITLDSIKRLENIAGSIRQHSKITSSA